MVTKSIFGIHMFRCIKKASVWLDPCSHPPLLYTNTEENKTSLINDLKENQPKLIVVNDKVAVWSEVETLLKENYQQVKTDYSEFKVYKIK